MSLDYLSDCVHKLLHSLRTKEDEIHLKSVFLHKTAEALTLSFILTLTIVLLVISTLQGELVKKQITGANEH